MNNNRKIFKHHYAQA